MAFFRWFKNPILVFPTFEGDTAEIEEKIQQDITTTEERLTELELENHKKKGLQAMPHVIQQFLDGLKKGNG